MAITGGPSRFPAGRRMLPLEIAGGNSSDSSSDELTVSSSDSVFGFLESGSAESSGCSDEFDRMFEQEEEEDEVEGENSGNSIEENKNFWEKQLNLLQATLYRTTALETGIRRVTNETMKELIEGGGNYCKCRKVVAGNNCRSCLMREVCRRLQNAGYNSAICKSKWRSSPEIPAGKHTYLDVIDNSNPKKGEVRVIIELNFRGEFEMARASEEYNQLISRLPEVFVGKVERLRTLVKVLCTAAKKCMKDKKMHMAPWRKRKYMQAKWFNTCERMEANASLDRKFSYETGKRPKASMLTMALLNMPNCKAEAVKVV